MLMKSMQSQVDLINTCDGLDEEELREYVADLITSQLNNEAFQLLPEQVSQSAIAS